MIATTFRRTEPMQERHLHLLCDVGELSALLAGSSDVEAFLQRIVVMVADHLHADVCSIYLHDESTDQLVLRATQGLKPAAVGSVRMKPGTGLVGLCFDRQAPVCEGHAPQHPSYRYFPETGEEEYQSLLAAPIQRGVERVGVLVIQKKDPEAFGDREVMVLRATASQLAGAIENARVFMGLRREQNAPPPPRPTPVKRLVRGQVASGGFAYAPAVVFGQTGGLAPAPEDTAPGTVQDLDHALEETAAQLTELQARLEAKLPEIASLIFSAHRLMLKDAGFVGAMRERIAGGEPPAVAARAVGESYAAAFRGSSQAYMREKSQDIEDLTRRILANLRDAADEVHGLHQGHIVIARELYPSDMLKLTSENIRGAVLVSGGATTHVSILARSLGIPLVIADEPSLLNVAEGTMLLLDADVGNIYVAPTADVVTQFRRRDSSRSRVRAASSSVKPATTMRDGTPVHLLANINLLSELALAEELQVEGIGLYRTEFPFLIRQTFPTEAEQYVVYRTLLERMPGRPVTIRTLDVGGEKALAYYSSSPEANPELGLRSIRFSLQNHEVFEQQLRAILRAGAGHERLRIMFPMIGSLDEFRAARVILDDCRQQLAREGVEHHAHPEVGMMIELPSVVELMPEFAREADFFSVGTNDFIQYMLGVDRANDKVAAYYRPHHPAVLRALARVARTAREAGRDISVCGEMAHEARYLPFLLGIGIRSLSVDPHFLPPLQNAVERLSLSDVELAARDLLAEHALDGVEARLALIENALLTPANAPDR